MIGSKSILLVDDEFIILESLKIQVQRIVGDLDIRIETASSGEEALEIIDDLKADLIELRLIICDYNLGDMNGEEVLMRVREKFPLVNQAILTGQANLTLNQSNDTASNSIVLMDKPWDYADLIRLLSKVFHLDNSD